MANQSTSSPALPKTERIDTYYVKLASGKVVARTADELAALPPELRSELVLLNAPQSNG